MNEPSSPPSTLRQKLKSSLCLSSPFRKQQASGVDKPSSLTGSSSTASSPKAAWIKSSANDIPELKDKCVSFIPRIGKQGGSGISGHNHHHSRGRSGHHRRHSISADFRYDAMSYSLNFDENQVGEFPSRSFSSRLPPSPTRDIKCRS